MSLKFCSFASGSSGNCYLVKNDSGALLIDAGISGKKIFAGLEETDTAHEEVLGVLLTHEHIDHVKSLPIVTKKLPNAYAYANESTWESIERLSRILKEILSYRGGFQHRRLSDKAVFHTSRRRRACGIFHIQR